MRHLDRRTLRQATENVERRTLQWLQRRFDVQRRPELLIHREPETRRHDPDDGVFDPADEDGTA
ncbi:hypothetical protein D3C83_154640 [compost metagenome]